MSYYYYYQTTPNNAGIASNNIHPPNLFVMDNYMKSEIGIDLKSNYDHFDAIYKMWRAKKLASAVSYSFSTPNVKMKNEYQRLWAICKPEIRKYAFCGTIALLHAGTFMILPTIYTDINSLMALKISAV